MIEYLLPFINTMLLYSTVKDGELFNKYYVWLQENVFPRLPISNKLLGGCILCTAFAIGVLQLSLMTATPLVEAHWAVLLGLACYNSVLTAIFYKYLTYE